MDMLCLSLWMKPYRLQMLELQHPLQVYLVTVIRDGVLKLMQQE